ncbi:hypothetical protein GOV13_04525 [Candidatus Pacearchaeota archaeon]|nr:hypothetical protein [Candidatus Pacearchaeota archaeon]
MGCRTKQFMSEEKVKGIALVIAGGDKRFRSKESSLTTQGWSENVCSKCIGCTDAETFRDYCSKGDSNNCGEAYNNLQREFYEGVFREIVNVSIQTQ